MESKLLNCWKWFRDECTIIWDSYFINFLKLFQCCSENKNEENSGFQRNYLDKMNIGSEQLKKNNSTANANNIHKVSYYFIFS